MMVHGRALCTMFISYVDTFMLLEQRLANSGHLLILYDIKRHEDRLL
jgi:hypothetical protein